MKSKKLPSSFKPLFWSVNYSSLNPDKDKKTIIVNIINYGTLNHWKWLKTFYGERRLRQILMKVPYTELRERVRRLAQLVFSVPHFNHAPRSTN